MMTLENLWQQYQTALKGFLHAKVANNQDVEDILQEVLLKTHQNLSSVHDQTSIKSWLFQIANNTIIDFYRRRHVKKRHEENVEWYDEPSKDLIDSFTPCLEPFINQLLPAQRQLLRAIELEGVTQKDFAEQHDIKYSTLKSRVKKARASLMAQFDNCCSFSVDSRGNIIDFVPKGKSCGFEGHEAK